MERLPAHEVPRQVLGAPAVATAVLLSLRFRPFPSDAAAVHCCSSEPFEIALGDDEYAVDCAEGVGEVQLEPHMPSDHSDQSGVQHYRWRQQMPEEAVAAVEWPANRQSPAAMPFEGSMFGLRDRPSRHLLSV